MRTVSLGELNRYSGSTVNPLQYPDEVFELYSVPSYESQYPEIIKGEDIGSSKVTVEPGDILICKINPRINRVWVVTHNTQYRLLASSEWIVVRSPENNADYLRHYFKSKRFQTMMVSQVTGIGGSLTRAQPKQVATYPVPLPDRGTQDRIADILNHIERIVALRTEQLSSIDEMVKSRFIEMFGDLKANTKNWPVALFTDFAEIDGNMTTDYEKYANYPHIGIDSIEKGTGALKGYRTVKEDGVISGKYIFTPQHIIYSKIRPNLNKVALPDFEGLCSADAYPILPNPKNCNRVFLALAMRSEYFLEYILQFSTRTNLPKVNRKDITGFRMPLPPLELQRSFAAFVAQTDKSKVEIQNALNELEILKKSLMQQYFG